MRVLYLGTAEFAVPPLETLVAAGAAPALVITQPEARRGRGRVASAGPVARAAADLELDLFQPDDVNCPTALERIRRVAPELAIVVAYGQKLAPALLAIPDRGTFNIHASLLPRHRGAAPIQKAILEGDDETGVTLLEVVEQMDAGGIVAQQRMRIEPDETAGHLHDRLARLGAELLGAQLELLASGKPPLRAQDPALVTWAHKLTKEDGCVSFRQPAHRVVDHVRAMTPWPGAFCHASIRPGPPPERLIITRAQLAERETSGRPGEVLETGDHLVIACGVQAIEILSLKRQGKRELDAPAFLRGFPLQRGDRLR